MKNILVQITELEENIQTLLLKAGDTAAAKRFKRLAAQAILDILDEFSLDELQDAEKLVKDALRAHLGDLDKDLRNEISRLTAQAVKETAAFYRERGEDLKGLTQRLAAAPMAKEVKTLLSDNISKASRELREATTEVMEAAIRSGMIDKAQIEQDIAARCDAFGAWINTNAQTAVGSYNQVARNEIADLAGIDTFYYYGSLRYNSRPFCRAHIGKTFTREQIGQMDNGMLDPVMVFKGGYRCIHSWLAVRPEWDDDIPEAKGTRRALPVRVGKNEITVIASKPAADRLQTQAYLQPGGYRVFYDAETNDNGFTAIHDSWWIQYHNLKPKNNLRRDMDEELATGQILKELGHDVRYNINVKNMAGGAMDFILDENPTELYIPEDGSAARRFESKLNRKQSDYYMIRLDDARDEDYMRKVRRIALSYRERYGTKTLILFNYQKKSLEKL